MWLLSSSQPRLLSAYIMKQSPESTICDMFLWGQYNWWFISRSWRRHRVQNHSKYSLCWRNQNLETLWWPSLDKIYKNYMELSISRTGFNFWVSSVQFWNFRQFRVWKTDYFCIKPQCLPRSTLLYSTSCFFSATGTIETLHKQMNTLTIV